MFEIEVKVRVREPERIKHCLNVLGFKFVKKESQKDIYFKSPYRNFGKTGEVLRVRNLIPGSDMVTLKGPKLKSKIKVREEIEVKVDSGSTAIRFLEKLGYEPWVTIEKERQIYKSNKFNVGLDKVTDLGFFMEIEARTEGSESKLKVEQEILAILSKIGISKNLIERKTYLELALQKRAHKGCKHQNIKNGGFAGDISTLRLLKRVHVHNRVFLQQMV